MRISLFLTIFFIISCTSPKSARKIASLEFNISTQEEESIVKMAYECLNKVKYISGDEVEFKKDEPYIKEAFSVCLSQYIKIKTISPQGDEQKAVIYWSTIFENLNIPYKIYQTESIVSGQGVGQASKRWNLVATIAANGDNTYNWSKNNGRESIIITHHMDVVDANPEQWFRPELAFGGIIEKYKGREYVWGRGAFDMKGTGIAHFLSMYLYRNTIKKRTVDIHFLALADEEQGSSGAIGTLKLMGNGKPLFALSKARVLLNEGGGSIKDTPVKGKNLTAISVEQKGGAWLKLSRRNPLRVLKSLNKLGLLKVNRKKERKFRIDKKIKCSLVKISGPDPKVNVVTSKLTMSLDCTKENKYKQTLLNKVKDVIVKGHDDVKFKISKDGSLIIINIATASSSHGSVGLSLSAMDILASSLYRLRIFDMKQVREPSFFKHKRTAATKEFVKVLAKYNKKLKLFNRFSFIAFAKKTILKKIENEFDIDGIFKTNCRLTNFLYENDLTRAYVDCRLLHSAFKYKHKDNHAQNFIKRLLRKKFLQVDLKVELINGWNYTSSSFKSKDYLAIADTLTNEIPNAIVTPYLNPSGSDSAWFRNPSVLGITDVKPIASYGVFPAVLTPDILSSLHGSNERFPTDQAVPAIKAFYKIFKVLDK
jgi:acetylornithine deacetylase/succinyl-diaminopimelate desuccinylase-like protein